MTSALFGTSKNSKLSFPATCIYFGKEFQLRNTSLFQFHGFQPVFKDCLHVAMWTIQKVQITISCSNFNTELHKGEISVHLNPSQFAKNAPECPVLENFPLVRPSRILLTTTPHDISTPENKDTPLFDCIVFLWLAVLVSRKLLLVFVPCLIKNNIEVSLQVKNVIH